jgi:hypothetical protein
MKPHESQQWHQSATQAGAKPTKLCKRFTELPSFARRCGYGTNNNKRTIPVQVNLSRDEDGRRAARLVGLSITVLFSFMFVLQAISW